MWGSGVLAGKMCVLVILHTTILPSWLDNLDQTLIEEKRGTETQRRDIQDGGLLPTGSGLEPGHLYPQASVFSVTPSV